LAAVPNGSVANRFRTSSPVLQRGVDLRVDHPVVAADDLARPVGPVAVHDLAEGDHPAAQSADGQAVGDPGEDEVEQRREIEVREGGAAGGQVGHGLRMADA